MKNEILKLKIYTIPLKLVWTGQFGTIWGSWDGSLVLVTYFS